MKTIIAGSRSILDPRRVGEAVAASGFAVSEVVSGTAQGVDLLGEQWAAARGLPVKRFPAQWYASGRYDRGAGHRRNGEMARYADALVAVWDGASGGTADMIRKAKARGLKVYVHAQP